MPKRLIGRPSEEITMPRWVAWFRIIWGAFITVCALVVLSLWYRAVTTDEEADRNARIQSCSSVYAATYSAWDSEAGSLFGRLVATAASTDDDPDPEVVAAYSQAVDNTAELAKLRIGLAQFSAESVERGSNDFACPSLPERLMVQPIAPGG